jgi:membrane protein
LHSGWDVRLINALNGMVGPRAADAVKGIMSNAKARPQTGNIAGIVGLLVTAFGASIARVKPSGQWMRTRAHALALRLAFCW